MKQFKLTIAYDGTNYFGWQVQEGKKTIAQVMRDTYKRVFGEVIVLHAASRTDAGVHALGQVAVFTTTRDISAASMLYGWNNRLPTDIRILSITQVPLAFHPRKSKQKKIYWYDLFLQPPLPFDGKYGWYVSSRLAIERLEQALDIFKGTHDFRAFCAQEKKQNTIRTIEKIECVQVLSKNAYRIIIQGSGFLRHMIRRIIGACVALACSRTQTIESLRLVLEQKNPNHYFAKAPAQGLFLHSITYDNEHKKDEE